MGGSVNDVFVNATIGIRTGAAFGFDIAGVDGGAVTGAGGISAGVGGTGAIAGLAGNVTNITADAIASIVAGRLHVGQALESVNLATKVDAIILNGSDTAAPTLVHEFTLSYDGVSSPPLLTDATPFQVAAALNALIKPIQSAEGVPEADQGVTVASPANGAPGNYVVTFLGTGAQDLISGGETATSNNGIATVVVQGTLPTFNNLDVELTFGTVEEQNISIGITPFTLSFTIQTLTGPVTETTTLLPANATPLQVENALNALPNIALQFGVTVTAGTGNNNPGYLVTFNEVGPQPLITPIYTPYSTEVVQGALPLIVDGVQENNGTDEVQNIAILGSNPFTLSFGGDTTTPLLANDTPLDVFAALNNLASVQAAGGVSERQLHALPRAPRAPFTPSPSALRASSPLSSRISRSP